MVTAIALLVLILGTLAIGVLSTTTLETRRELNHLIRAVQPPKDHLLAAERQNDAAAEALSSAVVVTGIERTQLLSQAITYGQQVSSEWSKYRSESVGLPGEKHLIAKYLADQASATALSSSALVPIVNTDAATALPQNVLVASGKVRDDLIGLHSLYRRADRATLSNLSDRTDRFEFLLVISGGTGFVLLFGGTIVAMRMARRTMARRFEQRDASQLAAFETRLRRGLELIDTDVAAFGVAERALREALPEAGVSLLVADASRARLVPISDPPVCGVSSPDECPALKSASALIFPDSSALDACPILAANTTEAHSASCVPVTIAGRGAAVLQLVGPVDEPPARRGATDLVARAVGDRVTLLQAFATFQLQAARDPLTGLLNRRSLESAVDHLVNGHRSYSVAFCDLDHFKQLNDLHGHEAGDRALRAFSLTLRESLRPEDLVCRWGGEEFVIVMPDCDVRLAVEAMERVRTNLAIGSIAGQTAAVTASFGVAHSDEAESFAEVVDRADLALRQAKDTGRNRVVRYEPVPQSA